MEKVDLPIIPFDTETIREKIYFIRGRKVMMDKDLDMLYGVPTHRLNEAVKRNLKRFPEDFMFQINKNEALNLISQIAISSHGGTRRPSFVFTEQGIAMLSSVLNSERAILVNIQIIRIFIKLRDMIEAYRELREKVEEMEKNNESSFQEIFRIIKLILRQEEEPKEKMGFRV